MTTVTQKKRKEKENTIALSSSKNVVFNKHKRFILGKLTDCCIMGVQIMFIYCEVFGDFLAH